MKKVLFIIVTRMYAEKGSNGDEFVEDWGGPQNEEYFFSQGEKLDLLVIHGYREKYQYQGKTSPKTLPCDVYEQVGKKGIQIATTYGQVVICYHPQDGGMQYQAEDFNFLNHETIVVLVRRYSSTSGGLAGCIDQLVIDQLVQKDVADEVKFFFPRFKVTKLSILKHRIAHLFLPIDIDLQGLIETGFREDYWREVVEEWKGGRALKALDEARSLIYGKDSERDTVEKVLEGAGKGELLEEVEKFLPSKGPCFFKLFKIDEILEYLGKEGGLEELRKLCKGGNNPFHCWLQNLEKVLNDLMEKIKQGGVGR